MCLHKALGSFFCELMQLDCLPFQDSHKSNCPNNKHVQDNIRYSKFFECNLVTNDVHPFGLQKVNEKDLNLLRGWWKKLRDNRRSMYNTIGSRNGRNKGWVYSLCCKECCHELNCLVSRGGQCWCWWWCRTSMSMWPRQEGSIKHHQNMECLEVDILSLLLQPTNRD